MCVCLWFFVLFLLHFFFYLLKRQISLVLFCFPLEMIKTSLLFPLSIATFSTFIIFLFSFYYFWILIMSPYFPSVVSSVSAPLFFFYTLLALLSLCFCFLIILLLPLIINNHVNICFWLILSLTNIFLRVCFFILLLLCLFLWFTSFPFRLFSFNFVACWIVACLRVPLFVLVCFCLFALSLRY